MNESEKLGTVINGKSRTISQNTGLALWAKAAGRCQICGKKLFENEKMGIETNISQKAHIRAFSPNGPRHKKDFEEINDINNLMLLCYDDHHTIDVAPEKFSINYLQALKKDNESKVASVIDIFRKKTTVLYYSSNISKNDITPSMKKDFNRALLSNKLFSDGNFYVFDFPGQFEQQTYEYFQSHARKLKARYLQIQDTLSQAEVVSVFAIAPQPSLIYLGYLLNDENDIRVFQPFRYGDTKWNWKESNLTNKFVVEKSGNANFANYEEVNIIISITAEIDRHRIEDAVSSTSPTLILRSDYQGHDAIKSIQDSDEFIRVFRNDVIEFIRQEYPSTERINIFPAMPACLPVKIGMNYQKNIDIEWRIFNQVPESGFVYSLSIMEGV